MGRRRLLRHQLRQSLSFNLLDAPRVRDVLMRMARQPDSTLDPPTAREIALRTGAARIIFGAISRVGDSYSLDVEIERPDNSPARPRGQWDKHWAWTRSPETSDTAIPEEFLAVIRSSSEWMTQ